MANARPRYALAGALLAVALAAAACGSSTSAPMTGVNAAPSAAAAPAAGGEAPARADADASGGEGGSGEDPGAAPAALAIAGPLIVRTGSLSLEATDLAGTLLRARAAVTGLGGYVSDSQRSNAGGEAVATITYRIPAGRWDEALDALAGLATTVIGEDTRAVEVTGQVVDLDARIANLRATEQALQAIMTRATKISDVLEVQNQLTGVQGEIEQLTAQRTRLADQAAFGTLAVTWTVPLVALTEATEGWNLGVEFDRAVAQLIQVGQGLLVVGLWLVVVVLPVVGGLVLAAALVMLTVRRLGIVRRPTV